MSSVNSESGSPGKIYLLAIWTSLSRKRLRNKYEYTSIIMRNSVCTFIFYLTCFVNQTGIVIETLIHYLEVWSNKMKLITESASAHCALPCKRVVCHPYFYLSFPSPLHNNFNDDQHFTVYQFATYVKSISQDYSRSIRLCRNDTTSRVIGR